MKTINSIQIKSNGSKKTFRTDDEKIRIIHEIDNSGIKKWESCMILGVTPGQVSVWRRKLSGTTVVSKPKTDFEVFQEEQKNKIDDMIMSMFSEWKKTDMISIMKEKITKEIVESMSRELNMKPTEITLFFDRKRDLQFSHVNRMFKYLNTVQ